MSVRTLFVLALAAGTVTAQLSGTYTIKPDSTGDFLSLGEVADSLNLRGIAGDCVFDIYSGTYSRNMWMPNVNDTGSYTITFRAVPGQTVTQAGWVEAANTDRVKLEGITFVRTGLAIYLRYCSGWRIEGCDLLAGRDINITEDDNSTYDSVIGCRLLCDEYAIYAGGSDHFFASNFLRAEGDAPIVDLSVASRTGFHFNTVRTIDSGNAESCMETDGTNRITNNIFVLEGCIDPYPYEDGCLTVWDYEDTSFVCDYNCFWVPDSGWVVLANGWGVDLATWQSYGLDLHSIEQNPMLVDSTDVHLQSFSPCIDRGTPVPGIPTDIDGDTRGSTPDIGADEWGDGGGPPAWPAGWHEVASMPTTPSSKPVKYGGWLEINPSNGLMYAQKGYKSSDFYSYDPIGDAWTTLNGTPYATHPVWFGKPPGKGSQGCCDGNQTIYVTQGNNTLAFWAYDISQNVWTALHDVPTGESRKKVKGGTDMVYVPPATGADTACIYLLKGYRCEFYRYNVLSRQWAALPDAPAGTKGKWGKGSFLVRDGGNIYAAKAKYNELHAFDITTRTWTTKAGMPLTHPQTGKNKKLKDGGSGCVLDHDFYCLKGGNTQDFWCYSPASNSWSPLDTMPSLGSTGRKKRVKYGAGLVSWGYGVFFALKGNKTCEMWRYVMPAADADRQPQASGAAIGAVSPLPGLKLELAQNPVQSRTVGFRYALPGPGPATIDLHDITGRCVASRTLSGSQGRDALELPGLSNGVYLLRLSTGPMLTTRKLVIQH